MPETLERAEREPLASNQPILKERRRSRTSTIWTLIVLSLLPGVVIALFREEWLTLPAGIRAAVYLVSAILVVAACSLIMLRDDQRSNPPRRDT